MAAITTTPIAVAYRDESFLSVGISASATTITVSAFYKDVAGVKTLQGLDSTSGWAEISLGGKYEVISFGTASVNATTKVTTLTDVRRGLAQTGTTATFAAGTGRIWPKGSAFRVIDFSGYNQNAVYIDRSQTFAATQTMSALLTVNAGLIVAGTSSYIKLPELTTTQRDNLTPAEGMLIKNSTTGTIQSYTGGAWASVGTDATANMSTTVAGKAEEAAVSEQAAHTATGGTGARLVPAVANLVTLGADGTAASGAIPTLNTSVSLDRTIGGLGTNSGTAYTLLANGTTSTAATQSLASVGTSGQLLTSNGASNLPTFQTFTPDFDRLYIARTTSNQAGASSTSEIAHTWSASTGSVTISGNTFIEGDTLIIKGQLEKSGAGNSTLRIKLGGTTLHTITITSANAVCDVQIEVTFESIGASAAIRSSLTFIGDSSTLVAPQTTTGNVDTTGSLAVASTNQQASSDATYWVQWRTFKISRIKV